jgi:hypothetical protein
LKPSLPRAAKWAFMAALFVAGALAVDAANRFAHSAESPTAFNLAQESRDGFRLHHSACRSRCRIERQPNSAQWIGRSAVYKAITPGIIAEASHFIGTGNPTGFAGQWCKAFTNFVLRRLGYHPGPSLRAIDALRDGMRVSNPQPGDLAVMYPHVTFFDGFDGAGGFVGLGGNQHRNVTRSHFSLARVVAFIRPR